MAGKETPTTESAQENEGGRRPLSLLASEMFGADFHGEIKEEPDNVEPPEDPGESEEPETPEEGHEEPEELGEPEEAGEEEPISSLQELIEHNEWDPEWVHALKVPVKVDGKPAEATLQDLVASYQMKEAAEKRLEDAKAKAKTLHQELAEKSEALQGQFAVAAKIVERAEALLDKDAASIDWKALREDDPAEYSAKKAEIAERRQEVERMKRDAAEDYRKATEKQWQETRQQQQQRLQAEQAALLEKLPEWGDQTKAAEEKTQLASYLISQGFTEHDVMGASDHRLIVLARKAMLYDTGKARTDAAKKKVAKVPKVLKPGAPKPKEHIEKQKVAQLQSRLKKTGSIDDAFALLKARRSGG
jgi:hypothetical protein